MPTLAEVEDLLGDSVGANLSFTDELNLVRARLIPSGNWKGSKELISLPVYSDADGNSIVTLPREFDTILKGALRNNNVLCSGMPMGVRNEWAQFSKNGLGYGGLTDDFDEVTGRYSVFQEWSSAMRIRLKFEVSETAGTIYLSGTLNGEDVWALNNTTWEKREAMAFVGTTAVTSTKYYDAHGFKITKPTTFGRVYLFTVDDDGVETLCGIYEPAEKFPRWRRYKVPECSDVEPVTATTPHPATQYFTKDEILSMFADGGTITVSADGAHDLVYAAYITRILRVVAEAGAGPYVHAFTLDNSTVKDGGTLRIKIEMAASANITLRFYDNTVSGPTLLKELLGDSDNQRFTTLVFSYSADDAAWSFEGEEV